MLGFEELRARSVLSPNPVEKSLTDDAAVENEGLGSTVIPRVWCTAASPGTKRAFALMR